MPAPHSAPVLLQDLDNTACRYFGVPLGTTQVKCLATFLPHPEQAAKGQRILTLEGQPYLITDIEVTDG